MFAQLLYIYIYISHVLYERRSSLLLTYRRWRFSILIYDTRERKGEDAEKRYRLISTVVSLLFPWSIDSQKMPVTFVSFLPPFLSVHFSPFFFFFVTSFSVRYISFFFWITVSLRGPLSLPPSFSFSRSIGSREQAGMPPQEYEKCNKKGENCRHRSSGERERGRSAGVRGRNVKESVVNRPIYCLSSLFPSSRSGQFRIFNWTTRYSLPILSLSSRFFFPVRARYRPTWLGHFTSLIWELCGEIGRSLIGTRVYIISRRAWWNSKFPIYSKKESRYRGYIVRIGYVLWRSGGGEKNGKKKKKGSLWSPPDADRHSRIRFYLSDISATDLLILVTGEIHQGILVRRPDIWYRRKMIENINIYFLISYQKL